MDSLSHPLSWPFWVINFIAHPGAALVGVLFNEEPDIALGHLYPVHMEDVSLERRPLDEAVLAEGAHVGLLTRVRHPVVPGV